MKINWFKISKSKILHSINDSLRNIKYYYDMDHFNQYGYKCLLNLLTIGHDCKDCGGYYNSCICVDYVGNFPNYKSSIDFISNIIIYNLSYKLDYLRYPYIKTIIEFHRIEYMKKYKKLYENKLA